MQIKNISDFKWYLPEKPDVRDGKDEDQRQLLSNALSPLSETFVQLFRDPSKNSIDLIYISLTTESLNIFVIPGNRKNPAWSTQAIPSVFTY